MRTFEEVHALPREQREAIAEHPLVRPAAELFSELWLIDHPAQEEANALFHRLMREAAEELGFVARASV